MRYYIGYIYSTIFQIIPYPVYSRLRNVYKYILYIFCVTIIVDKPSGNKRDIGRYIIPYQVAYICYYEIMSINVVGVDYFMGILCIVNVFKS